MARMKRDWALEELENAKRAVSLLMKFCGESSLCVLNDAVQCFASHPDWHGCDEDLDEAAIWATVFDEAGFNHIKPEYDILKSWDFPKDA